MRRRTWLLLPLLVLVLAAAACGGGDNSTSSDAEGSTDASIPLDTGDFSTPAPSPTPTPSAPAIPPEPSGAEVPGNVPAGAAPIKNGSKKAAILALQESLDYLGYSVGTPDGVFGAKTKKAIRDFQKDNGIKTSGVGDKKTIAAINKQVKEAAAGTSPAAPPTQTDVTGDTSATDTAGETAETTLENADE